MTIASQTSRIAYTGNGSTTAFAVPFYFAANADIVVDVQNTSGTVTTQTLGTNYTLTGATLAAGGTCTFIVAPTTAYIVTIYRVPPLTQTTSYNNNDPFPAKSHELALDKLTTITQYLKNQVDRSLLVATTDTPPMTTLPPAATRALKALTFDSLGNPSVSTPVNGTTVSSAMIPVVAASTVTTALTLLGIPASLQSVVTASTLALARAALGVAAGCQTYATRAAAIAATIDSGAQAIVTAGYAAAGDGGGALYVRYSGTTSGGFQSADGAWWKLSGSVFNVRQFGAKGDGSTDDSVAVQAALTAAAVSGGTVYVPAGNYSVPSGLTQGTNVSLVGEGRDSTVIQAWHTDVGVLTLSGNACRVQDVSIFGKGTSNDTGTFGATLSNAVTVGCNNGEFRNVRVRGGSASWYITGQDNYFADCESGYAYGFGNVVTSGSNWYVRCKFDHASTGVSATNSQPFAAWAALTAVTVGLVRITNSYAIQCTVAGTTGSSAPTLKNYEVNMTDGTATWQLFGPASFTGFHLGDGCSENHFTQCDFTSEAYTNSVNVTMTAPNPNGPAVVVITDSVLSQPVNIVTAAWVRLSGNEFAGDINLQPGFAGVCHVQGNWFITGKTIAVGAGVSGFIITNNYASGGAITVAASGGNHYVITGNVGFTVTDSGGGANKSVTGNVG